MSFITRLLITALVALAALPSFASPAVGNNVVGAAYIITNHPSGNKLLAIPVGSDGQLGPNLKAYSAEGLGLRGIFIPPPEPQDGLFSAGSVTVNEKAKLLATVNAGSNTVALFRINPTDPTELTLIGKPAPSGGEFPQSVAINSAGTQVCVLNGGRVNGVNCFSVHPTEGLVEQADTLRLLHRTQTTPPVGPNNTLGQVIFSPDDSRVFASVKGAPSPSPPGFLASWSVSPSGGLSADFVKTPVGPGGQNPFSMTPLPFEGTNAILSADPNVGFNVFDLEGRDGREDLTTPSVVTAIPNQFANCWTAFSARSGNFYVTDAGTGVITEVHIDSKSLKATLVTQYPQGNFSGPIDSKVVSVGNNDFLFVLAANESSIHVLHTNEASKASRVQTFALTQPAKEAGVTFIPINLQGMGTFIKS